MSADGYASKLHFMCMRGWHMCRLLAGEGQDLESCANSKTLVRYVHFYVLTKLPASRSLKGPQRELSRIMPDICEVNHALFVKIAAF